LGGFESEMEEKRDEEENLEETEHKTETRNTNQRKIIMILDMAQLETVKTKKGEFQLLNCDDHINIMRKHNKDPQQFRPDILHQVGRSSCYSLNRGNGLAGDRN
jgi:rRNA pseudouridine-1189 N-methylase Emg1 (Nep1/Mra1 family)